MSRALEDLLSLHNCGTVDELNGYIGALEDSALRAEAALREIVADRECYFAQQRSPVNDCEAYIESSEYWCAFCIARRALSGARPGETT